MTNKALLNSDQLLELAAQVFQEAAFCFIEPLCYELKLSDELLVASLDFNGKVSGRILIAAPPTFACIIAGNLLGLEPDDEDVGEKCAGALGELLNMVAGQLFSESLGADNDIQLGLPETRIMAADEFETLLDSQTVHASGLVEEEQRVDFAVTLLS